MNKLLKIYQKIKFYMLRFVSRFNIFLEMADNKLKYGYWFVRGAGQIGRLLLAYTGANWENVPYAAKEAWFDKDKKELGLVFPNLPYLIDGDFKLTETRAINHYIIKRSGKTELLGKSIQDEARVESILGVIGDIRSAVTPLVFDPEFESKIKDVATKFAPKLGYLAEFIGEKNFALGYLTQADFSLTELSYYVEKITPELYAEYPFLKRIRDSFEALPEIKAYYASETAVKGPFFPPYAAIKF